ncbi:uncharacterized protein LOC113500353 [Trichoplusia ni]|uniref:Uncharacterized protein LOC113500353 n=1 Tax=Trichoplusia ni TaxID=7111 RepID=A0A7E5W8B0_TRINI|nr:uncharacterized protein LOC113500353 [Trichoplusia ni]
MCCIFTCCGWVIDLVQRLWTFTMSCCISSAVCCVMLTSSMSGIALGYNYSLAEYIDLKETNVSIYLKRGVFDDEIADDMDWRRAGRMPVAGHIKSDNLVTGASEDEESANLKSGRRLDDSVFEADDQNKYEGSLMKLTARPQVITTNPPASITDDVEMGDTYSKFPVGSLDHMKAIQSIIDARRNMASSGTTYSPLATYNMNNQNFPMYLDPKLPSGRRMMGYWPIKPGDVQPARKGVPDEGIGARENWVIPKRPDLFNRQQMPDYAVLSPTYPPPITMNLGPRRTSKTTPTMDVPPISFATRTTEMEIPEQPSRSRLIDNLDKDSVLLNDKFLLEGEPPGKSEFKDIYKLGSKPSEEEYEDEIKGLPVRRRRSVVYEPLASNSEDSIELSATDLIAQNNTTDTKSNDKNNHNTIDKIVTNKSGLAIDEDLHKNDMTLVKGVDLVRNIDGNANPKSSAKISKFSLPSDIPKYALANKGETIDESSDEIESKGSNILLERLITTSKSKIPLLWQDATHEANPLTKSKKIKIITKRKPFERTIVLSKYVTDKPKVFDARQTTLSTAELLNSISISLGEAGLLRNPASSSFVKLLESTLT